MQLEEYRHRVLVYHLVLPHVKKGVRLKQPSVPPFLRKNPRGHP